jgi:AAA+ superfamily predicted ATPase
MEAASDLRTLLASRYPLLVAETTDEPRFMELVRTAATAIGIPVWTWSVTHGLARDGNPPQYDTGDANKALAFVAELSDPGVFVFADVQSHLADPLLLRRVKDIAQAGKTGQTLVLTGADDDVPPELSALALPWIEPPPAPGELEQVVQRVLGELAAQRVPVQVGPAEISQMVEAVRGLSEGEAERLIRGAAADDGKVDPADVERVRQARADLATAEGELELVDVADVSIDDVGGMDHLKEWLRERAKAMQPEAKAFGLDPPKGVLLTGIPGCGKSMMAKAVAKSWSLPLALLDPARLFSKYVGESEDRMDKALEQAGAMAPVVLWIDEIEKGFATGGDADGGVAERMLGTFLRWMQERESGVFVVATSNDVLSLPPEFLRKGRFDEIFFVDLPGAAEREAIFRAHLARRHRDPSTFDLPKLAAATEGFSGAEIEAAVVGGMYRAFSAGTDLTTDGILAEVQGTVPLSKSRAEDIAALRAWAATRAVPA